MMPLNGKVEIYQHQSEGVRRVEGVRD